MKFEPVVNSLWRATRGQVNIFAIQEQENLTLIDTGYESFAEPILAAAAPLGQIRNIIVTHAHIDHAGSLSALMERTGATAWMHGEDAALVEQGLWSRPYRPAPTLIGQLMTRLFINRQTKTIPAATGMRHVADGDTINVAGGVEVFHLPGHSAGQIALGWTSPVGERVLFAGDACMNVVGLGEPLLYEDRQLGLQSIRRLADLAQAADLVLVTHGQPIRSPAKLKRFARRFK